MHRICVFLLILSAAPQALEARASERARSKADAWVGREASELLMQLRVDGGRVRIDEIEATGDHLHVEQLEPCVGRGNQRR